MRRAALALAVTLGLSIAPPARAEPAWLAGPALGLHDLPAGQDRALVLQPHVAEMASRNTGLATDADGRLGGGGIALLTRPRADRRLLFRLDSGRTDVEYQRIFQDLDIRSLGLGADLFQLRDGRVLQVGGSIARLRFRNEFIGNLDRWDGHAVEAHVRAYAPLLDRPGLSIGHFAGGQVLALTQEAHTLQATLLDRETRVSRSVFYGIDATGELRLGQGHRLTPWAFAAIVHDFADRPPQRPSALVTGFAPGNAYTLFSDQLAGIPDRYPRANTAVFGLGLSGAIRGGGSYTIGAFVERNGDYATRSLRLGLTFPF
ncbi:autotransporter outer membrane beta-barrel domain-containing protein [Rhodovulum euryhalinum]|uniref:Uncharacterized protein n=1 Tax=Rhodovulum euryhalinum TaxID=35805 RepID=A0A4R2KGW0_9RHOB|nr:autotransporter outer membrane beta-barrel domain-containing protein [Rhodovulum euryhalinum]TCO71652.1 hypothetical protein EV655_106144 [Rhodovulum euryhalinum]